MAEGGELSYVTTLRRNAGLSSSSGGDLVFGALMRRADGWSAETSADGRRLAFEAASNVNGYEGGGGRVAYLYSADTGEIACVSCRPDGGPTLAGPDARLLDIADSRAMSEDGSRVFFTSPDVLMPGAEEGKNNVYEWEEGQLYLLAVAEHSGTGALLAEIGKYHDASASGDSVFLSTNRQLAPQDRDFISDVYAVRVNGGFPLVPESPECQVDESAALQPNQIYCQGDRTPQPPAPNPSSAGFSGPGNPPEGKPRPTSCPKGKVRRRGKCVKRPKRGAQRKSQKQSRAAHTNRGGAK